MKWRPMKKSFGQTVQLPGHLDEHSPHRGMLRGASWQFPLNLSQRSGDVPGGWLVHHLLLHTAFPSLVSEIWDAVSFARLPGWAGCATHPHPICSAGSVFLITALASLPTPPSCPSRQCLESAQGVVQWSGKQAIMSNWRLDTAMLMCERCWFPTERRVHLNGCIVLLWWRG